MSIFGDRLRAIRTGKNLSQKEVSEIFNITQNAISKYESGINEPPLAFIETFCKHFGVSADYLLGLTDVPARRNAPLDLLRTSIARDPFADLTPEQRAAAEQLVQTFREITAASMGKEA